MQENNGVEALSTPIYFSILGKLNKSMCSLSKIKGVCMQMIKNNNRQSSSLKPQLEEEKKSQIQE